MQKLLRMVLPGKYLRMDFTSIQNVASLVLNCYDRTEINKEPHSGLFGSETLLVNCYSKSDHLLTIFSVYKKDYIDNDCFWDTE